MKHTFSTWAVFVWVLSVGASAAAQSPSDEFRCALQGAERAPECLRATAERTSDADLERATSLLIRTGDLARAEQLVERGYSQGERARVWPAMLAIGRALIERREHRAALDWYERWRDRAKRESTADVLASVHTGIGHALLATRENHRAYDAYRLAVHVWRAEHAYKLGDGGEVLNEYDGERGYVAPALRSFDELARAAQSIRDGVENADDCVARHWNHERTMQRCLRALRPPPRVDDRGGASGIVDPFVALIQTEHRITRVHPTRSHLDDPSFHRGNSASSEALLGMVRIQHDAFMRERMPRYTGSDSSRGFDEWTRRALTPFINSVRWTLDYALGPIAQQAMATNVIDAETGAAQQLAHAYEMLARWIREAPMPPDWNRPGEPYETMRAEY